MDSRIQVYLVDILTSIDRIESFFEGKQMRYEDYHTDWQLRLAVERSIEIIGEAMNRILKIEPDVPISHAKAIVGTRNRIIHAYDAISDDIIWAIIVNHLTKLKEEVSALLAEE
ncbi:MAG: HepT-like ribonuclease domain-containing protein [Bacteroidales bacterium]|nr:HepT-like ribonuclease domain-containing protein [Bacteroidales bacterium]